MRFLDTNILLYSVSNARAERGKTERALALLAQTDWTLSVQVLQEFYAQATRASRRDALTHDDATALISSWTRFRVQETTLAVLRQALALKARHGISYWDAAILAAARTAGCSEVFSEDLAEDHDYDGVRVVNPFR